MAWHRTRLATQAVAEAGWAIHRIGDRSIVLIAAHGEVFAVEDRCSHAGCAFSEDGEVDGVRLICDCHGSEFDLRTGRPVRPPAIDPIATFGVRSRDGMIEVEL